MVYILPETYPSLLMPSFAKASSTTDDVVILERYLSVDCDSIKSCHMELTDLVRLSNYQNLRSFDFLFLGSREGNARYRTYRKLSHVMGEWIYDVLVKLHSRALTPGHKKELQRWLKKGAVDHCACATVTRLSAVRRKMTFDAPGGNIVKVEVLDSVQVLQR